jgi:Putative NADP-dependent oxidoreductases
VVAAATGPVGGTVGQIAKLKGCRTVGIAGGSEKCLILLHGLPIPLSLPIGSREIRRYGLAFAIGIAIGYMICKADVEKRGTSARMDRFPIDL